MLPQFNKTIRVAHYMNDVERFFVDPTLEPYSDEFRKNYILDKNKTNWHIFIDWKCQTAFTHIQSIIESTDLEFIHVSVQWVDNFLTLNHRTNGPAILKTYLQRNAIDKILNIKDPNNMDQFFSENGEYQWWVEGNHLPILGRHLDKEVLIKALRWAEVEDRDKEMIFDLAENLGLMDDSLRAIQTASEVFES